MLGTINLRFVVIVSVLTISFLAGWWINGWRWEAKAYAAEQQLIKSAKDTEKLAIDYEVIQQSKDKVQNVITKQVYVETTKSDYSCRIPNSGVLILQQAVETANSGKLGLDMPSNSSR